MTALRRLVLFGGPLGAHQGVLAVAGMVSLIVAVGWLEFGWGPEYEN